MSFYRQYRPMAALADFIECYWELRTTGDDPARADRLIPGGRVELIFNFAAPIHWLMEADASGGSLVGGAQIMGQRDRIYFVRQTGDADLLGIRFKPGGLKVFTGMPASALLNSMVPAEELFGAMVNEWASRLYRPAKDEDRIHILDGFFLKLLQPAAQEWMVVRSAVEGIRAGPGFRGGPEESTVQEICEQTGWYYKKLERAFLQTVGYTPKYYSRIVRFNKAIRHMSKGKPSLTSVSYLSGYYDQSHFIRDFKKFAGTTPGGFHTEDHKMADILIQHQMV
jgi:AraC-like DNA-binding protein